MLCPCAMSFSQKWCPAPFTPVSCSFPEPCPGPQCCLHSLLEGQLENSWSLGGKCCITSNPSRYPGLRLPCFLQHVQDQHLPVSPLGWATGTQCLLEAHLLASLQRQLGFQGYWSPPWESALQAVWAQTLTTLLLKLQTYPWIKSPLCFYGTSGLLPLTNLFLSQLLTLTTRALPPYRQHCSTQPISKTL